MTRDEFKDRFERYANGGITIFALLVLYWLIQTGITVYFTLTGEPSAAGAEQNIFTLVYSLFFSAYIIAVMVMVIRLLQSIRRGKTPFTMDNVKRLRRIGVMLMLFELLQRLTTRLFWAAASGAVQDGETVVYYYDSTAGMVLIVGLAVLSISLVFQYGVDLQQLSDETL